MPSPWNVSPAPRRRDSISLLNETSKAWSPRTEPGSVGARASSINTMSRLSDISSMHIRDIDLNLLRLFDAVYRTRNVSRAAELLDLTQPAASQGLSRLRTLIQDPLFMRSAGGMQPTPKAQRLAEPVRQA